MNNSIDPMGEDQGGNETFVSGLSNKKWRPARDRRSIAGRQVVEHNDGLAGVRECMHHMAADISGAASHQDGHSTSAAFVFP
jgi:hypothetical protein